MRCLDIPVCEKSWCGVSDEYKHLISPEFCFNEQLGKELDCFVFNLNKIVVEKLTK